MRGILIKPVSSRGHLGEDLEILRSFLCRSSSIPHQEAIHGFQIRYATSVFLHYYVLCSNMVIYVDLNVSYSWYQSQPWIRIQNIRNWRILFFGFSSNLASIQFRRFSSNPNMNIFTYLESTRRDDQIGGWHVAGGGRTRRHAH